MEKINKENILEGFKNGSIYLIGNEFSLCSRDGWWIDIDAVNNFIKNEKDNEFLFECMKGEIEAEFKRSKNIDNATVRYYMEMFGDDAEILLKAQDFMFNMYYSVYEKNAFKEEVNEALIDFQNDMRMILDSVKVDGNTEHNARRLVQYCKNLYQKDLLCEYNSDTRFVFPKLGDEFFVVVEELIKEPQYYEMIVALLDNNWTEELSLSTSDDPVIDEFKTALIKKETSVKDYWELLKKIKSRKVELRRIGDKKYSMQYNKKSQQIMYNTIKEILDKKDYNFVLKVIKKYGFIMFEGSTIPEKRYLNILEKFLNDNYDEFVVFCLKQKDMLEMYPKLEKTLNKYETRGEKHNDLVKIVDKLFSVKTQKNEDNFGL